MRSCRADVEARETPDTTAGIVGDLRTEGDCLRVVAPAALQRTAFQEDGRADAGTIVQRAPLNVENDAFWVSTRFD